MEVWENRMNRWRKLNTYGQKIAEWTAAGWSCWERLDRDLDGSCCRCGFRTQRALFVTVMDIFRARGSQIANSWPHYPRCLRKPLQKVLGERSILTSESLVKRSRHKHKLLEHAASGKEVALEKIGFASLEKTVRCITDKIFTNAFKTSSDHTSTLVSGRIRVGK